MISRLEQEDDCDASFLFHSLWGDMELEGNRKDRGEECLDIENYD